MRARITINSLEPIQHKRQHKSSMRSRGKYFSLSLALSQSSRENFPEILKTIKCPTEESRLVIVKRSQGNKSNSQFLQRWTKQKKGSIAHSNQLIKKKQSRRPTRAVWLMMRQISVQTERFYGRVWKPFRWKADKGGFINYGMSCGNDI